MTNANTHARENRAVRSGRSVPNVAAELRRLTARDRWLLDLLHEHHVFSTEQVAALGFDNLHTARNRLTLLARREVLARFRDCVRPGSQQWRWSLGWVGACWIASRDGAPTPNRSTIADRVNRLAASPRLAHLLGINGLFVDLAAHARHTPDTRMDAWWSERTCRQVTGELARPDARRGGDALPRRVLTRSPAGVAGSGTRVRRLSVRAASKCTVSRLTTLDVVRPEELLTDPACRENRRNKSIPR